MLSDLEKAIISTIIYFDIFNYPLTSLEVYKYLLWPTGKKADVSLFEIKRMLETSPLLKKRIQTKQGFYFLTGRETIISRRKQRYLIAEKKLLRARKFIKLLSKLPFVQTIHICNSLSYSNSREDSDIDLAIVCQPNAIWLTRILAVTLMELLGQRPSDEKMKNKICLSFYVSDDNLDLENYQSECPDIHFIFWQSQFLPIYQRNKNSFSESNAWSRKYLPNQISQTANNRRAIYHDSKTKRICENMLCRFLKNYLNKSAKKYQLKILPTKLKVANQQPTTDVVLENNILKLHANDRRQEYNQKWRIKYKSILKFYENSAENY